MYVGSVSPATYLHGTDPNGLEMGTGEQTRVGKQGNNHAGQQRDLRKNRRRIYW